MENQPIWAEQLCFPLRPCAAHVLLACFVHFGHKKIVNLLLRELIHTHYDSYICTAKSSHCLKTNTFISSSHDGNLSLTVGIL